MKAKRAVMPAAIAVVAIAVLGILGLGGRGPFSAAKPQQSPPPTGSLRWFAAQAYQQGQTHLIRSISPYFRGVSDLNAATSQYSVFVGELVATNTVWDETGDSITTWYKFRNTERLTQRTHVACAHCTPPNLPSSLLPLQEGELLVPLPGGSVLIDNVVVEQVLSDFTAMVPGQNYLLFLNFDDANKVGTLSIGPSGALLVTSEGTFEPVMSIPEGFTDVISTGLTSQYGNSLAQLRAAFNPPPPPSSCDPTGSQQQYCTTHGGMWNAEDCLCEYDPCIKKPWLCD